MRSWFILSHAFTNYKSRSSFCFRLSFSCESSLGFVTILSWYNLQYCLNIIFLTLTKFTVFLCAALEAHKKTLSGFIHFSCMSTETFTAHGHGSILISLHLKFSNTSAIPFKVILLPIKGEFLVIYFGSLIFDYVLLAEAFYSVLYLNSPPQVLCVYSFVLILGKLLQYRFKWPCLPQKKGFTVFTGDLSPWGSVIAHTR